MSGDQAKDSPEYWSVAERATNLQVSFHCHFVNEILLRPGKSVVHDIGGHQLNEQQRDCRKPVDGQCVVLK